MGFFYSAFGLTLRANCPIPGLSPTAAVSRTDTQIWFGIPPSAPKLDDLSDRPWYVSDDREDDTPALRVWRLDDGAYFRLLYADGSEFFVDRQGRAVWATWPDSLTLEDAAIYLLGPVLGLVLRLRDITCLHASAVTVGDRAIAFVGPPHAGKSTTAAAFARTDHPVLTDDIVALAPNRDQPPRVLPAYPHLRLWPDSVGLLYGSEEALPRLTPTWDKRALDLTQNGYRFEQRTLPLAAIYVLAGRSPDGEPSIQELRGRECLLTLLANTYVGYLLDAAMRAQELEALGQLVRSVPVRRVVTRTGPAQISGLCARILDDYEALACTPSPTTAR